MLKKIIVYFIIICFGFSIHPQLTDKYSKGIIAYGNGNYQLAVQEFEEILKHDWESPELYYNLGNAYFGLHQFQEARVAFEKSANLGLNFISLHWKLFEIHKKKRRIKDAIRELTFILDIDPTNAKAQAKLAELNPLR